MSLRVAAVHSGCTLPGEVRVAIGLAGTDSSPPQEAPAGFNTPSFDGAQTADGSIVGPAHQGALCTTISHCLLTTLFNGIQVKQAKSKGASMSCVLRSEKR